MNCKTAYCGKQKRDRHRIGRNTTYCKGEMNLGNTRTKKKEKNRRGGGGAALAQEQKGMAAKGLDPESFKNKGKESCGDGTAPKIMPFKEKITKRGGMERDKSVGGFSEGIHS